MEQILNNLPSNPRHITWRGIALIVIALMVAVGFLFYAGGFAMLARIFGSHAGTEHTFTLAGLPNLENNRDAASWLVQDSRVLFDGTGAFSSFTGVPDYIVPDSLESGFIMPVVTSLDPTLDTFTNHRYTSAALDFRQTGIILNTIKIYASIPQMATLVFSYRTADTAEQLDQAERHELPGVSFTVLPSDPAILSTTIQLDRSMKQYLQLIVDFTGFDSLHRPAVYGWVLDYGNEITTESSSAGSEIERADLNGDGVVNSMDIQLLFEQYGKTTP